MAEFFCYDEIGNGPGMVSAKRFADWLATKPANPLVRINSPGGDVFEALAIFNLLRERPIDVQVDGLAASAASVVAMAGNTVSMASNAMLMIHCAWTVTAGNKNDCRKAVKVLAQVDDILATLYSAKTGKSKRTIAGMMADETWLNANDAYKQEFCDRVGAASLAPMALGKFSYRNTPRALLSGGENEIVELRRQISERRQAVGI